jgi:hypothetical protein
MIEFDPVELSNIVSEIVADERKRVRIAVHSAVIRKTPFKTGRARGGWFLNLGDTTDTIINNVEYIERLEAGWSKKAPDGMVDVTLAELEAGLLPL